MPEFDTTSEIVAVPVGENPVILPEEEEEFHEKVAPATFEVGAIVAVPPEHISCVNGLFVIEGEGSTVTTKLIGVPMQDVGAGPVGVTT